MGGSAMALLPSPDFTLIPEPVHQNRAPHLLPSTSTHSFPTSRGESRSGISVYSLANCVSDINFQKIFFCTLSPPHSFMISPKIVNRNMSQSTESPGFGTDICIQTTWQSTVKGGKALQTVICTRPCTSLVWKGTNLLVSNIQCCLLLTRVL